MIEFPNRHALTETGINFPALVNNRNVNCTITFEALQDRFHILNNFEAGYQNNLNQIHRLARTLINRTPNEEHFTITTDNP